MPTKVAPPRPTATRTRKVAGRGIVTAIVAVTGVVDEVADIIQPGIFGPALAKRWPKCVHHHQLEKFTGRVVAIEEWLPGDPRLPKVHQSGKPWPAAAGALVATMQFNLRTKLGAEAYEWAKFYHESNESAWSIGYIVPKGMDVKRGGIRIIRGIDLFEVSIVLHGAHPLTMGLEVKSALSAVAQARTGLEFKTATDVAPLPDDAAVTATAAQPDHSGGVMVALYPDGDTASRLAHKGGLPPEELHVTLAYLGDVDGAEFTRDDVVSAVRTAVAGASPFGGQIGGIGMFPPGDDGTPIWAPVDLPALPSLREGIVRALDDGPTAGAVARDHGYTPHMTLGYDLETVDPVAPAPVQFDRATVVWGKERVDVPFGPQSSPPLERKGAVWAVQQARSATPMETKMSTYPGSYQETIDALNRALEKRFCKKKDKGDDSGGVPTHGWVNVQATYPDHVIATVYKDGSPGESYRTPYTFDGEDVELGESEEVRLTVVVTPEEDEKPAGPADLVVAPIAASLAQAAQAVAVAPLEVKALDDGLRPALLAMFDALDGKGLDVAGMVLDEDDEDLVATADYPPLDGDAPDEDDPEDLSPAAIEDKDSVPPPSSLHRGAVAPADDLDDAAVDDLDDDEPEPGKVLVDPEQMRAELDALGV